VDDDERQDSGDASTFRRGCEAARLMSGLGGLLLGKVRPMASGTAAATGPSMNAAALASTGST